MAEILKTYLIPALIVRDCMCFNSCLKSQPFPFWLLTSFALFLSLFLTVHVESLLLLLMANAYCCCLSVFFSHAFSPLYLFCYFVWLKGGFRSLQVTGPCSYPFLHSLCNWTMQSIRVFVVYEHMH